MKHNIFKKPAAILFIAILLFKSHILANQIDKEKANAYIKQAETFLKKNKIKPALRCFKKALKINPKDFTLYLKIARLQEKLNKLEKSIKYAKKAIEIEPNNFNGYLFLAFYLNKIGDNRQAIKYYIKTLKINKNAPCAWNNAAKILRESERPDEAITFYKQAISLKPNDDNAHFGLAQAYLLAGDFENGLPEMELGRTKDLKNFKNKIKDPCQIKGKTIFIPKSWGYGDAFQFVRYAKLIKDHGGNVIMHVHWPLEKIISSCPYVDKVTIDWLQKSDYDNIIALWSLPSVFNTTLETIPNEIPYLYADPVLVYEWGKKLFQEKNFKIGICWAGSGAFKSKKNIPLKKFAPIAQVPGVRLYSIQKGRDIKELENISFDIHDFGNELDEQHGPFMDTAAIMKNLDLVITVDTSIAHLAGALGVKVWTLLPFGPDWRWLLKRTDTPWYPTMKLFRATKPQDWDAVINNIKCELESMLINNF